MTTPRSLLRLALLGVVALLLTAATLSSGGAADTVVQRPAAVPDEPVAAAVVETPTERSDPAPAEVALGVADPVRIIIPAIEVDAEIRPVGLLPDGAMEVPEFGFAGDYTEGPRPGEPGPAVIAAHVDSFNGPDVFFRLSELEAGEEILIITEDGEELVFVAGEKEMTAKDELPADRIWTDTEEPVLRLITCGGDFDQATRHYTHNWTVYAALKG